MTMPNVPPTNEPGAPGSPAPYTQPPNVAPVTPAKPQGFKHIANALGVLALALFAAAFFGFLHYDRTAADGDGGKGALYLAGMLCLIGFGIFHALHAKRQAVP